MRHGDTITLNCEDYTTLVNERDRLSDAFGDQARELETAVKLLEELGAQHALEFRRRAYPELYPRPTSCTWRVDGVGFWVACSGLAYPFRRGFCPDCGQPTKAEG